MAEITTAEVRAYLKRIEGRSISLRELRTEFHILPETKSFDAIRNIMFQLAEQKVVKSLGLHSGDYKVLMPVEPVKWWDNNISEEPISFKFPKSYDDNTEFGIEDCVEVFAGDLILIAGASNYGKTCLALSLMGENLSLMPVILMGSEYTAANGKISPKFKRRMKRMGWVEWLNDGKPRFTLLPVGSDYEDYVAPDQLNVIDWISLPGEYYLIDRVMKAIKDRVGNGLAIVVIQKNKTQEFGEGGERTQRYADVELKIDPFGERESLLTLGKVKAPKGKATGRTWAFDIVDYGANLHNIREVVKCPKCWGRGYIRSGQNNIRCDNCSGRKYIDK